MIKRGDVTLNTPVRDLLPAGTRVPDRDGAPITLAHLARHVSGLPRLPDNMVGNDQDPYAGYTPDRLYDFLSRYQLQRTPGEAQEYSNFGAGLLGHALSLRAGCDYEQLLSDRILSPLGMASTMIEWRPDMTIRRAVGHDDSADPVAHWTFGTLAGAGGMQSTADDLIRFISALVEPDGPFAPHLAVMLEPNPTHGLGLGLLQEHGAYVLQHEGGTGGFRSYLGCLPRWRRGAVVLANASSGAVTDLGIHCIDRRWQPRWFRRAVTLDVGQLDRLTGTYSMRPGLIILVERRERRLMARLTGQSAYQVFPASQWHFFYKCIGAQLTFEPGPDGSAIRLILHQNNIDQIAQRISP